MVCHADWTNVRRPPGNLPRALAGFYCKCRRNLFTSQLQTGTSATSLQLHSVQRACRTLMPIGANISGLLHRVSSNPQGSMLGGQLPLQDRSPRHNMYRKVVWNMCKQGLNHSRLRLILMPTAISSCRVGRQDWGTSLLLRWICQNW